MVPIRRHCDVSGNAVRYTVTPGGSLSITDMREMRGRSFASALSLGATSSMRSASVYALSNSAASVNRLSSGSAVPCTQRSRRDCRVPP